jgi:carbon monoxide dehydrogenase subunit G
MAINFGGEFLVKRTRDEVYDFLTDPRRFAPLLPEYEGMSVDDETHFRVKVKVGVSYIKGSAEVNMHLTEAERPNRAVYQGRGNVAGGGATMTAGFDLLDGPEGTQVNWKGEAQVFGKLASMAGGLLQPLAKKNVEKLIAGLREALAGAPGVAQPAPQAATPEAAATDAVPVAQRAPTDAAPAPPVTQEGS